MFKNKFLLSGVILGLIFLFFGCGQVSAQKHALGKAPDFELLDSNGDYVKLSEYSGKAIILNFFATWCPPCKVEIPEFNRFKLAHPEIVVLGIMLRARGAQDAKKVKQSLNIEYPVLVDDGRASVIYGPIRYIPTTIIIDENFNIIDKHVGMLDQAGLEKKLGL